MLFWLCRIIVAVELESYTIMINLWGEGVFLWGVSLVEGKSSKCINRHLLPDLFPGS
jgi:hypothetical protein